MGTIVARNTTTGTFGTPITVPNFAIFPGVVTPNGQFLYAFGNEVSTNGPLKIFVIPTATNAVATCIEVPNFSLISAAVSPSGEFLYALGAEVGSGATTKLFVIATATNTVVDTISAPPDRALGLIAFSPNGERAYVPTHNASASIISAEQFIELIDVSTHTIVSTITNTGSDPLASGINAVKVSDDGAFLYVTQGNQLFFIDLSNNTSVGFVQIDTRFFPGPGDYVSLGEMRLTPDGSKIYVTAESFSRHGLFTLGSKVYIINAINRSISNSITMNSGGLLGGLELSPERACGEDFTTQTLVSKSAFSQFIFPQLQYQFVAVFNGRTEGIRGPVTLFLTDIQNASFVGNNASSNCYAPAGTRYATVSSGPDNIFSPFEIVIVPLLFLKTGPGPITYSYRVVSGAPGQ
jgi:hypothetical protein